MGIRDVLNDTSVDIDLSTHLFCGFTILLSKFSLFGESLFHSLNFKKYNFSQRKTHHSFYNSDSGGIQRQGTVCKYAIKT
jgi:hypothetical protein